MHRLVSLLPFVVLGFAFGNAAVALHNLVKINN